MWYKMIVKFESGNEYTYEDQSYFNLMIMKARLEENQIRRENLGMETDKIKNIELTKSVA